MNANILGLRARETETGSCVSEKKFFRNIFMKNFYCLFFAPTPERVGIRVYSSWGLKTIEKVTAVDSASLYVMQSSERGRLDSARHHFKPQNDPSFRSPLKRKIQIFKHEIFIKKFFYLESSLEFLVKFHFPTKWNETLQEIFFFLK